MATPVSIVGDTGVGKTHSIQFLNPKETFVFDADKNGLPFKGWRNMYSEKFDNYLKTSNIKKIRDKIREIDSLPKYKHIVNIVIDTMNRIMVDDEIRRMKELSYDKWKDLAIVVYELMSKTPLLRDDIIIFFMFHEELVDNDYGYCKKRILTSGKKLAKIKLESLTNIVLYAETEGEDGKNKYYFITQRNKNTAKSPAGMFKYQIPNNLQLVRKAIIAYEGGENSNVLKSQKK